MKNLKSLLTPKTRAARFVSLLVVIALVASIVTATAYVQQQEQGTDAATQPAARIDFKKPMAAAKKEGVGERVSEALQEMPQGPQAAEVASNYTFTTATNGTLTDMSTGTTQLLAANIDDTASSLTGFPFDFYFQGVRYNSFSVNENGVLRFNAAAQSGSPYKPLAQASIPILTAYGADQRTHTTGKVHTKMIGTAPNRAIVVEWLNNQSTFSAGGTADLTYQIRFYETTGVIEYVYGKATMSTLGAADANSRDPHIGFSSSNVAGTVGSVTAAQSGTPDPTFNGTSNDPVENLYTAGAIPVLNTTTEGSRRIFTFTPPTPTAPTNLTFTSVTPSSMTLNWTDSANETLYAVYRSTDGTNYTLVSNPAQNSTSFSASGLSPSTNYFWQVYAVSEGALSTALSGSQATAAPGNIISTPVGGNWSAGTTWVGGVVPTATDNVTITDGATVTIDTTANAFSVNVGTGLVAPTTLIYQATTARALTVATNVTIAGNGTFSSAATGTVIAHALSVGGDLTNNGVLDFSTNANTAGAIITFTSAANNTFGGTGATTDIRAITINKGTSSANVLELNPTNFTVQGATSTTTTGNYLTLTNGTFKISGTFTGTHRTYVTTGTATYIPANAGLWLNNPNYTITGQSGSPTVAGLLRITQGTHNVGTASGNSMDGSAGAQFIIEGGTLNTTGRFSPQSAVSYTQSGGTVNVCTVGQSGNNFGSFELFSASSSFTMSGGTINLVQANTNATVPVDYQVLSGTVNITGGTLNVGTAATVTNFNFRIAGSVPNMVINNTTNNKTATVKAQTVVFGDTTVSPGTTLNLNGFLFAQVGANLFNNGTISGNTTNSRLYFAGTVAQAYGGSGIAGTNASPLQSVDFDSTGGVTFHAGTTNNLVTNRIILFTGNVTNANKLTLGSGGASTGTVQVGNTTTPTNAGTLDVAPTFNLGTGGQVISYLRTTNARTTGVEINPTRTLTSMTYDDNDATHALTLAGGDLTLSSAATALTLTNGRIITGSNILALSSGTATVTRTNGYVDGNLRKSYGATGTKTFEVGTMNAYSPVAVNVTAGTFPANFTVKATQGQAPYVSGTNALARYWSLDATGLTANLTFNYLASDVVGTAANYQFIKNTGGMLSTLAPTGTPTNTQAVINNVSSFSDWTLAEPGAVQSGSLQFTSATYTDSETNADHTFNAVVSRTGGADGAVTVDYAVTDGTATTADNDYTVSPATGTLSWASGDLSAKNITITVKGDMTDEPDETVNFAITNAQGGAMLGTPNTAVLTITNDDAPVVTHYRSATSGNWNANSTWETSSDLMTWSAAATTPTAANAETITIRSPHTVTVTASVDADQLTVDSGGSISVNNGQTFTIADGTGTDLTINGTVATAGQINNNGQAVINNTLQINEGGFPGGGTGTYAYHATTGVLIFNNTSGSYGVNNFNFWPTTNGPQNVTVTGAGGITMNVARTVGLLFQYAAGVNGAGNLTLNGTSQVNTGGFMSGSPTYGGSSLLKYNTGGNYGRNGEWLPNVTSGAGYPNNVQLSNNTNLDLPNGSSNSFFQMAGNLTIDSGSTMNMNGSPAMTQPLHVLGNVQINGTLTLSTASGGDLKLQGSLINQPGGTYNFNNRAVFFEGAGTQNITDFSGTFTIPYVAINKTGGTVALNGTDLTTLGPAGGASISFVGGNSTLTLNGRTVTLGSSIGSTPAGSGFIGDANASMSLQDGGAAGSMGTLTFVSGSENLQNLTVNRTGVVGTVTLGSNLTIGGTLTLTAGQVLTGANTLSIGSAGTATRTSGYIIGTERKTFSAPGSFTYHVGTANGYSPVEANVTTVMASQPLSVKAVEGKQPNITGTNALNRYWQLDGIDLTADLTFQYALADVVGTESNYKVIKYDGSFTVPANQSVDTVNHRGSVTGVSSFSDWTLAEQGSVFGELQFSSANYNDNETNATHDVTVTVKRTGAASGAVSVNYATSDGTATAGSDYTATSGTLNWANGDMADKTFTVSVTGDMSIEPDETINLTLSAPTGGAVLGSPSTATITIQNDDAATLSIADVSVNESAGTATFVVTQSQTTATDTTFTYSTANVTATAGSDYAGATNQPASIMAGQTSTNITITILPDNTFEGDERFNVNIGNAVGANIADATGVGNIIEDDTAPSYLVNTTADDIIGTCDAAHCSLREAIMAANAAPGQIDFAPNVTGQINLLTALPTLSSNYINVNGPGAAVLTVRRDDSAGNISIFFSNSAGTVTISGLTISNAQNHAIWNFNNSGTLNITNCVVSGNHAGTLGGAGLYTGSSTGTVNITGSTFTGNTANGGEGGAIRMDGTGNVNITDSTFSNNFATNLGCLHNNNTGTLTVTNTLITNNSANFDAAGINNGNNGPGTLVVINSRITNNTAGNVGGGIKNSGTGAVTVIDSTIDGNSAASGGGIFNTTSGTINVTRSTISNNTATSSFGGGIFNDRGTINVTNSTISTNHSPGAGGGIRFSNSNGQGTGNITSSTITGNTGGSGGGLSQANVGAVNISNTIVAGNTASNGSHDISGTFVSGGYNLIGNNTGGTITPMSGDQIGTSGSPINPLLGALANNGGPTHTHALQMNSPAIDAGNAFSLMTDQRGFARTVDITGVMNVSDATDIGSFEVQASPASISATAGTPQSATINTPFAVQLQATVRDASNNAVGGVAVTFTAPASGPSGTFPGNMTSATVITNASGVATAPVFTANSTPGSYDVEANTTPALATPALFNLTNVALPSLSINDVTMTEGSSGTTNFNFTVTRSGNTTPGISVQVDTADNSAAAPNDYTAIVNQTVSFASGETMKQVTVQVSGDPFVETDENFFVNLSNPSGATISDAQGEGIIQNDDNVPNTVYVDDDFTGPLGSDPDGAGPATAIGYDAFPTVQGGASAVASGGTINVAAGTYIEDVAINQPLSLIGAGANVVTVSGAIGGNVSTIQIFASNVTIAGLTITREGNNTTDWNNPGLNSAGIAIQGQAITNALIRDNKLTGNRTAIDINNSNGHTVRNNIIDFNRTGMIFRNQTDNMTVVENFVTNNWTVGILFLDASGGTNSPVQSALHSVFSNNDLSANWYAQIVDRQTGGSLPAPDTTNLKNFRGNWFGTTSPVVTTANSAEPGYAAQIPVAYGGTATPPGGQPDIAGPASANFKYIPFLLSGTDTNIETTPGRGTNGFQGVSASTIVWPPNQNGWAIQTSSTATVGFVHGPATPPLGVGSGELSVGADGNSGAQFRQVNLNGTPLGDLTALSYSTYTSNDGSVPMTGDQTVYIILNVDLDANGTSDTLLFFEPEYQHGYTSAVPDQGDNVLNTWQTWNALAGGWWSTTGVAGANPGADVKPLSAIIAAFPNAVIHNSPTTGSLRLVAGFGAGSWDNFVGNVDNVVVGINTANTVYDFEPLPRLSVDDVTHMEGDSGTTDYTFTVSLSRAVDLSVTVDYATADDTAMSPADYAALSTTQLTFNPGETMKQVTVQVNGDAVFESNEQFFLNLSNPNANATILDGQGTGTITNDDTAPTLAIDDVTFTGFDSRPNAPNVASGFTVTLTGATEVPVTVNYATANDTATAGEDYTATSGTLTFQPGETTMNIPITILADNINEPEETFFVNLDTPTNATIADNQGTGTIPNDDAVPSLSISDVTMAEGDMGATTYTFNVVKTGATSQAVTVDFETMDGTATTADGDYQSNTGSLSFTPTETTKPITVTVNGDNKYEANEAFTLTLSNPGNATISSATASGFVNNDDSAPTLAINNVTVNETNSGTTDLTFNVTKTGTTALNASVQFTTANSTATDGVDYAAQSDSLTFMPAETTKQITVTVNGDTTIEGNETFFINLSAPVDATLADAQALGTIDNDDGPTGRRVFPKYDFDGDSKTDIAIWDGDTGNWHVRNSNGGAETIQYDWGRASLGDVAVPADYDGDGRVDFAVFRPSEGNWYIVQSTTGTPAIEHWGIIGDRPVPGDYDGDNRADVAVWRESEGNWYIKNSRDNSVTLRGWGTTGDVPVLGDFDGDRMNDIAVYRPSEGNWYIINSSINTVTLQQWGAGADRPVPADFDNDGLTDIAIFRAAGDWYIRKSAGGVTIKNWGNVDDKLVAGDYDGDGLADIAVWRPTEGTWYIINSATNTGSNFYLGAGDDVPVPGAFVP